MKLLVLGGGGMLGHKLCQVAAETMEVNASLRKEPLSRVRAALASVSWVYPVLVESMPTVEAVLDRVSPDAVVNCVGIVKQLDAGKDPVACLTVNALFPHLLARLCRQRGIRMITISTDCVFSGSKGAYREDELTDAEDLYGRTKALGEVNGAGCLTLRTSIIGRELSGSHGLLEWFLAQSGRSVSGYSRAIFSGLTTLELSRLIVKVIQDWPRLEGLYQVAAEPIDKHDLLCLVKDVYRLDVSVIPDARVNCNRSLDGSRFAAATGYRVPAWRQMIQDMYQDPTPYEEIRKP